MKNDVASSERHEKKWDVVDTLLETGLTPSETHKPVSENDLDASDTRESSSDVGLTQSAMYEQVLEIDLSPSEVHR